MIMKKLFEEFNSLPNDAAKWKWIMKHQDKGITVFCDNDDTYAQFANDEDAEFLLEFDQYIGWADGIFSLMDAVGIKAEAV